MGTQISDDVEHSPEGILIVDTESCLIEFNEAAHMHLGYTKEAFVKLRIADIDSSPSAEEIQFGMRKVLSSGKAEFEAKRRTKGGEVRNVRVITEAMPLAGCCVFYTIWQDITEFRRANLVLGENERFLQTIIEK